MLKYGKYRKESMVLLIFWENKERYIRDTNYEEIDYIGYIPTELTEFCRIHNKSRKQSYRWGAGSMFC